MKYILFFFFVPSQNLFVCSLVGTVMAQAIALEYYAVELDRQLEIFMKMNANIQSSKNFRNMDDQELIKMVASNNIVMTNVLSKVIRATAYMY